MKDYSIEDIFEKKLLLLLPFYAFYFSDNDYKRMNSDAIEMGRLIDGLDDINSWLSKLV